MPSVLALVLFLAPLSLVAVAMLARREPGSRPRRVLRAAELATLLTLGMAVLAGLAVALAGPGTSPVLGLGGIGLAIRLDALSVLIFGLVAFVGAVVVRFSRNYLDGDGRQGAFIGGLCLTLAAVSLLVLAGNLGQLVLGWVLTSLALHRLLVFYPERRGAVLAARKKFVAARIGDACLVAAVVLLLRAFGTADIGTMLEAARLGGATLPPTGVATAAVLLAFAALLKSAQFPTHGWLIEVMETPTPVSALLHAGIVNAGGFLVIRFADVMLLAPGALHLLAVVGCCTALVGATVMLTQTSIKLSLAWSTVAQMGFMMLQCGLGAFPLAVLHIVAHSLYKAHAFLASGSVIGAAPAPTAEGPRPSRALASLGTALGLYLGLAWLFGITPAAEPVRLALGAILAMGLSVLVMPAVTGPFDARLLGRTLGAAAGVTVAYLAVQAGAHLLLASTLPPRPGPSTATHVIIGLALVAFAAVTAMQAIAPSLALRPGWQALRVHLANGLYVNAAVNRLAGALRRPATVAPLSILQGNHSS
jgi:NAD(P)H-quinone oxidoreductase subunit 5